MNRVHEQCPKIDSGTVPSQTGSKQAECTECTARWPAARLGCAPRPPSRLCPVRPAARPYPASCVLAALRTPREPAPACLSSPRAPALAPLRAQRPYARTAPAGRPSARSPARPAPLRPCPAPRLASAQMGSSPFQVSAPIIFFSLFPTTGKF